MIKKPQPTEKLLLLLLSVLLLNSFGQAQPVLQYPESDSLKVMEEYRSLKASFTHAEAVKLFRSGDFADARELFGEILLQPGISAVAHYNRGLCNLRLGNQVEALLDFGEAIRRDPQPEFYFGRGMLHYQRNDTTAALADFQKSLQGNRYEAESHIMAGQMHLRSRNYSLAGNAFGQAFNAEPENLTALNGRAITFLAAGDTAGALDGFAFSLETDPDQQDVLKMMALIHFKTKEYSKVFEIADKILAAEPDDAATLNFLALAGYLQNNTDTAQYWCNRAIDADPRHPQSWNTHGILSMLIEDFQRAEADFNMALSLSPLQYRSYYNRALAREMLRNDTGACEDWQYAAKNGVKEAEKYVREVCE